MEKYIFILGRNWRLALAEIDNVLQLPPYQGRIVDYSLTAAIVEFDTPQMSLEKIGDLMVQLGSVQKIGKVLDFVDNETFEHAFPEDIEANRAMVFAGRRYIDNTLKDAVFDLFPVIKGKKLFVATSIYPKAFNSPYYKHVLVAYFLHYVNKFFNTYLKEQGAKSAIYYKYPQKNIESGNLNPIFPHHFFRYELFKPNRVELLYSFTEEGMYLGRTLTVVDSNFQKELDEERPMKDFRQTMPPKFAKTLLSFLGLGKFTRQQKVLDPFCGIGTTLQFAYMTGLQVYGSDIEPTQIAATRKNVQYTADLIEEPMTQKSLKSQILQSPIETLESKFPANFFDGIITEPLLLPFYRENPSRQEAQETMQNTVLPLYKTLLDQAMRLLKPGRRIAFVGPLIETERRTKVGLHIGEYAEKLGFIPIQLLRSDRIEEKQDPRFQFHTRGYKTLFDAGSKIVSREFYLFVKPH